MSRIGIGSMQRACKLNLKFITESKRRKIATLLESYRATVNFFVRSLWDDPGSLNKETLARLPRTRLSERYKSQALKQALSLVVSTKRSAKALGKPCSVPDFSGAAILDAKFISIEDGKGSFDTIIKLSCLKKGSKLTLPTRATAVLNKWREKSGAKLIQGGALSEDSIIVWVEIPDRDARTTGDVLGVDIGVNKLLSDSNGNHYGRDFKRIRDKIVRKSPGSKAKQRALRERDNLINHTVNLLPWGALMVLGVERLIGLKKGKKKNRGKTFRRAMAPWTYRQVITRIEQKAQENRVGLVAVDPRNTSRGCPACGMVSEQNRKGEKFKCISCNYEQDADTVGALNILARTLSVLGSIESPRLQTAVI